MQWSDNLEQLKSIAEKTGKLPQALENRPEVHEYFEQYVEAYQILGHYRTADGPIRFLDIVKYAEKIKERDVIGFVTIITIADRAFLKVINEKTELT